jgi:NADH:ubiquinone oxidoreductase subunit 4 (subunit M)
MAPRRGNFIIFLILCILTLGIYPLYFFVTRQQENTELFKEIRDELQKRD